MLKEFAVNLYSYPCSTMSTNFESKQLQLEIMIKQNEVHVETYYGKRNHKLRHLSLKQVELINTELVWTSNN